MKFFTVALVSCPLFALNSRSTWLLHGNNVFKGYLLALQHVQRALGADANVDDLINQLVGALIEEGHKLGSKEVPSSQFSWEGLLTRRISVRLCTSGTKSATGAPRMALRAFFLFFLEVTTCSRKIRCGFLT